MPDINLQDDQFFRNRAVFKITILIGIAFLILLARLFYLQIHLYQYHFRLSEENRVRLRILEAPRGLIMDRNGKTLARNRPSYQICILPTELKDKKKVFTNLMKIIDGDSVGVFDSAQVAYMMERGRWRRFQTLPILEDASMNVVALVEEHQLDLPGVVTIVEPRREYPYHTLAAHTIGYTAEISEQDYESYKARGYRLGNRIGVKGLEKKYESALRGVEGKKFVEVNVYGKEMGLLDNMPNKPAEPGNNLITTLDLELQMVAEQAVPDSFKGSVVAIDPRNGEVLVMLSSPRINGNIFSLSKNRRSQEWQKLAFDSNRPLNNRASIGIYDPGSTFKAIVSIAGFRAGKLMPDNFSFKPCNGGYQFGRRYQRCWKPSGHGRVNFYQAFKQSCDTYYYQAGLLLGMDAINESARMFGLGAKTGIDLVAERSGLLMDSLVYEKKFKRRGWKWTRGLILNLSIGQGQLVTPLQLANYTAGLGNGKVIYKPHLRKELTDGNGKNIKYFQPEILQYLDITQKEHSYVLEAMRQVVEEPGGTGRRAAVPGVVVGGKSGSAENPQGDKTHALFIAVAPLYKPEIAIAVIMENVGHGGSVAAPIAGDVLRLYFKRKNRGL
ncbi:MAG: penicillin-binding protein 2 [Fibrobacteria bacterium]|nr:penicillin-binding protein 2 [Fibrobacteria bacterium]